ncbi:MAG: helix-turn-helix transcriptional regulator [Methylococcales bacterium]|nr:helix-turn-helix transcriptional regulator [Methylococcales bacterium]
MYSEISAENVITRLKQLLNVKTDLELAEILGVSKPTISAWRQRNSVPHTICIQIAQEKNVSLDWLLTGEGTMLKGGGANDSILDGKAKKMLEMYLSLDDRRQQEVFSAVEDKKFICDMQRRFGENMNDMRQAA